MHLDEGSTLRLHSRSAQLFHLIPSLSSATWGSPGPPRPDPDSFQQLCIMCTRLLMVCFLHRSSHYGLGSLCMSYILLGPECLARTWGRWCGEADFPWLRTSPLQPDRKDSPRVTGRRGVGLGLQGRLAVIGKWSHPASPHPERRMPQISLSAKSSGWSFSGTSLSLR